jgi:type I restriction enzyme, S subunit
MSNDRLLTANSQVPQGYKQTDVGIIPEDWIITALETITDPQRPISYGVVQTGRQILNGIPCLRVVDINEGKINTSDLITTSHEISNSYRRTILKSGDLVMPLRGKVGDIAIVKKELSGFNLTRGVALIASRNEYSYNYLQQNISFSKNRTRLEQSLNGSALQELPIATLRSFKVAFPPTKLEQETIAQALSETDALIGSLEQLIAKKRHIKQGAMRELLCPKEGWVEKTLGDLANISRGASPRPIDSPIWFDENSEIGWVRISDVPKSGMFLYETSQRLSQLGVQSSRFVNRKNLIMSICATVGRPIITMIDLCIHDGFVVFENLKTDSKFMFYVLKSIEEDWSKNGQTGSQMNLNTNLIDSTKITIPPQKEEQERIATILSDMDTAIAVLEEKLTKTRQLKQGMMHELLTGRIRLVD